MARWPRTCLAKLPPFPLPHTHAKVILAQAQRFAPPLKTLLFVASSAATGWSAVRAGQP